MTPDALLESDSIQTITSTLLYKFSTATKDRRPRCDLHATRSIIVPLIMESVARVSSRPMEICTLTTYTYSSYAIPLHSLLLVPSACVVSVHGLVGAVTSLHT